MRRMLKRLTARLLLPCLMAGPCAGIVILRPDFRAIPGDDGPTPFLLYAHPGPTSVVVAGSWSDWTQRCAMAWTNGMWALDVRSLNLPFGRHEYKFIINGNWETGENRVLYANLEGLLERPSPLVIQALVQDTNQIDVVLQRPFTQRELKDLDVEVLQDVNIKDWHLLAPAETGYAQGYAISGDLVTFALSEKTYNLSLEPTSSVYVAGNFNHWSPSNPTWRLQDSDADGVWTLTIPLNSLRPPRPGDRIQFKFVLDGTRWLAPPPGAPNAENDGKGNVNLVLDPTRRGSNVLRIETSDSLHLTTNYIIALRGLSSRPIYKMTTPGRLLDRFYSGKPLGVTLDFDQRATTYRLFSPRATQVYLCLYTTPWFSDPTHHRNVIPPSERYPMWKDPTDGVWEISLLGIDTGKYYCFNIAGPTGDGESFDVRACVGDPYARAAAHAHNNTIVINPSETNAWFTGWTDQHFKRRPPQDLVIYEMHVRDMTIHPSAGVPPSLRGKYAGLLATRGKGTGLDHLKWLGVNALELLPIAEFSNAEDEYNWGYAPVYYFAPEASYGREPLRGSQYYEFKHLVNELHREGFSVILDVVFNHIGTPNIFYFIDKKYFFRLTPDFQFINFSGCGNDVRSEAPMMRRLIVDNIRYWVNEFHVDGFRFDLAELVDLETLMQVRDAVRAIDPNILLISEPWSFRGDHRYQLTGTGWAAWNGDYRYAVRDFVLADRNRDWLKKQILGSVELWAADPRQTINYLESHDDRTLADELCTRPDQHGRFLQENDVRANRLAATILFTSLGIPMIAEGQEFLRSKMGLHNTYDKGDAVNAVRWDDRTRPLAAETMAYYRGLIHLRLSPAGRAFRLDQPPPRDYYHWIEPPNYRALGYIVNGHRQFPGAGFVVLLNADAEPVTFSVPFPPGTWRQIADGLHLDLRGLAGSEPIPGSQTLDVTVSGISSAIFMNLD